MKTITRLHIFEYNIGLGRFPLTIPLGYIRLLDRQDQEQNADVFKYTAVYGHILYN